MAAKKKTATTTTPVQTEEIVKVEETVKVEKKTAKAAPKAKAEKEEKAVAEKKPAAKKTTAKKAVKTTFVVQAAGKEITMDEAIEKVKEAWTVAGNDAAELKEIAVYVKPEEGAIYYVANGDVKGKVEF